MSSSVIIAAMVLRYDADKQTDKQTDRQTNAGETLLPPPTAVCVGNNFTSNDTATSRPKRSNNQKALGTAHTSTTPH